MYDNNYLRSPKSPGGGGLIAMAGCLLLGVMYLLSIFLLYFAFGLIATLLLFRLASGRSGRDN